ncbi:cell envelope integrity protein TolA [Kluyvera intermedia]|uniref:cell envelope integrity protein TolA n=1 Tax=Kluyvera intermedia TaxID=61648 RepID=UPI001F41D972|nr:cell envelope integrity protein TolA [Kluyvera intermedia]EKU4732420.1 cell envelope integrity protein TolA [Kluyvera ascorbata]MCE9890538.1 cell envelope integrity protein TolA [Kluyvera intermedia]
MKRLILTAVALSCAALLPLSCQANADSLGINKDCDNHPVSQYGMDSITASGQYKAEPQKFMKAMTEFCNRGKTMGDMGFDAAYSLSLAESKKWTDANLRGQNEEQKKFTSNIASLLSFAMLNGFSGFDYPEPPEQKDALPTDSFKPFEICDAISSNAAERSTSQLPPQVQISLAEWNQIKKEFASVCFVGIMAGNSRKPADNRMLAGLNDIARSVYSQAYDTGSRYPALPTSNQAIIEKKEAAKAATDRTEQFRQKKNKSNQEIEQNQNDREKQREINHESQQVINSLRNAVMRRINYAGDYSGKRCSVKIWLSQKGVVLSAKDESGDAELCSAALQATKGVEINPMSDDVYKIFRNVTLEFAL